MNSTLIKQIRFQAILEQFPKLSKTSPLWKERHEEISLAVENLLIINSKIKAKNFLMERYTCPLHHLPLRDNNSKKISESIALAIGEPKILVNVCFSKTIEKVIQEVLEETFNKSLLPKVSHKFRAIGTRSFIDFVAE